MSDADNMDLKEMYNIPLNNGNIQDIYVPKTYLEASTVEVYREIYDSKSSSSPQEQVTLFPHGFQKAILLMTLMNIDQW